MHKYLLNVEFGKQLKKTLPSSSLNVSSESVTLHTDMYTYDRVSLCACGHLCLQLYK